MLKRFILAAIAVFLAASSATAPAFAINHANGLIVVYNNTFTSMKVTIGGETHTVPSLQKADFNNCCYVAGATYHVAFNTGHGTAKAELCRHEGWQPYGYAYITIESNTSMKVNYWFCQR